MSWKTAPWTSTISKQALEQHQPKLVGIVHASNTLGTINPVADLCARAGPRVQ